LRYKFYLFGLLNLADLFLTVQLLRQSDGEVYESNPVANWWFAHWGWAGLIGFKLAVVLFAVALLMIVIRYRPRAGRRAMLLACGLVGVVVLYSGYLLCSLNLNADAWEGTDLREANAATKQVETSMETVRAHRIVRDQLCGDLLTGRCNLKEAVNRITHTARGRDPRWLDLLRRTYPECSEQGCHAADLLNTTLDQITNTADKEQVRLRLARDFRSWFGSVSFARPPAGNFRVDLLKHLPPEVLASARDAIQAIPSETTLCSSPSPAMQKE
jgi:hypothetical protein